VLDRLVRRAVLAEPHGVVRPHPHHRQGHQRRQAHRAAHVVGEDQERRAVGLYDAAVRRRAVDDRAHRVLADTERHVAPRVHARELASAVEQRLRRLDEVRRAADHRRRVLAEARHRLLPGRARGQLFASLETRQRLVPAVAQLARPRKVPVRGHLRERLAPLLEVVVPARLRSRAVLVQRHVLVHALVDPEVPVGIEAHHFLGRAHLVLAERRAVRLGGVDRVRRRVGDVRADRDQRRALVFIARLLQRRLQRVHVLGVLHALHMPALRGHPRGVALAVEGQRRGAIDRDVVVVVAHDQLAQRELPSDRGRFLAEPLHQVAVRADHIGVVVDDLLPRPVEALRQEALGDRHAHRVREALPQRAGGDLDPRRVPALWVPRRARAPLTELRQVLEAQVEAAQVQQRVLQHARVARAQDETVAIGPSRVRRVRMQEAPEDHVPQRRQRHRRARVPRVRFLHAVHRQRANRVDRQTTHFALLSAAHRSPGAVRCACGRHLEPTLAARR
jgi:hypothetical protein